MWPSSNFARSATTRSGLPGSRMTLVVESRMRRSGSSRCAASQSVSTNKGNVPMMCLADRQSRKRVALRRGSCRRPHQPQMVPQCCAFIVAPEQFALLQFGNNESHEILQAARNVRRLQHEAVASAGAEPLFQLVGDI